MSSTIAANTLSKGHVIDSGAGKVTRSVQATRPAGVGEPANTTVIRLSDSDYPNNWYDLRIPNAQNVVID